LRRSLGIGNIIFRKRKTKAHVWTDTSMRLESATTAQLAALINKLQAERQEHLDAITKIDTTFERVGIVAPAHKGRGRLRKITRAREPAKKKGARKARRQFAKSASETVLAFAKAAGKDGVTGAQIVKH
jgi:hypothetical protein